MSQTGRSPLEPWIEAELAASRRRTLLVDGFNVLHTALLAGERNGPWWGSEARERLLARICAWPGPEDEIWVAFDGSQPAWSVMAVPVGVRDSADAATSRRPPGPIVHSVFVESADDWIVRRARRALEPRRTFVVSADRKVAGRARSAGCEVWTPWAFVARCSERVAGRSDAERDSSVGAGRGEPPQPREPSEAETGAPLGPRPSPTVVS